MKCQSTNMRIDIMQIDANEMPIYEDADRHNANKCEFNANLRICEYLIS